MRHRQLITPTPTSFVRCRAALAVLAFVASAAGTARADVPFHKVFITNAVEVDGQDKFPDWVVVVFPGGPPSGRPVAWPSLVEPGFQTVIDRKTLGTPKLWILPRAALEELAAAARDNDDALDGPVADLLRQKGVDCGKVDLEDSATLPFTAPDRRLVQYRLEDAAPGRCVMKMVRAEYTSEELKRPPSWARFAPRKKKADAGAGPTASASAAQPAVSASASSNAPSASPPPSAPTPPPATSAAREPPVPEPAKGCACAAAGEPSGAARGVMALGAVAVALGAYRRGKRRFR